jgi:oligopeptidase B
VLSLVPFVDVVTTMLDESLPLTAGEWVEWGDPRQRDFFDSMLAYSPYDNVAAVDYPDVLVRSGLNDPRVQYWEPTKWVAKLRATATGGQVLLKTHMGAGHQGQSGRYGYLEDMSFEYAWMLSKLVPEVETSR